MIEWEHTYVINLDSRKDRWEKVIKEIPKITDTYERMPAVTSDLPLGKTEGFEKGARGLVETTIKILKDALKNNYKNILVLEDDVFFLDNSKDFLKKINVYDEEWDFFHFGVIHQATPKFFSNEIIRLRRSYCCHAYVINRRVYEDYLKILEFRERPIDWVTVDYFQPHGRCLATKQAIAFQKPDYSNIREKEVHNLIY